MSAIKNHILFNHTYLQQLQDDNTIDEEAAAVAQGVRDWYAFCDASSIQTVIDSWVSPMLSILELEIQPLAEHTPHSHLLYSSWDLQNPVGLCYVTPPGADLDTTSKGQHWLAQAVLAARRWQNDSQNNSPLRWVILTNGDLWRLLDAHSLRRYEAYLQVDLGQIARGAGDITALRIFYHCFHRHAFVTPKLDKPNGLEQLLTASERATGQAEKHLKARVSHNEGIMAQLCLGFVRAAGKSSFTEAERDAIYRDATILLYRILFIFYAEARELLPMHNPAYAAVSLRSLVQQAISFQQRGMDDPQAMSLWTKLKRLFNAIYASDESLEIPAYNGGLFNNAERPYLGNSYIVDTYLSRALYDLACLPGNGDDYQLIDYRDLSVRHLGSLYEGMIEYKLFVAEEPMLARRDSKGNIHYLSQAETGGLKRHDEEIKQGDVYFAQSSGERRATGTYYTPEYIVHYIVEQTVGQGLVERRAELEAKLSNWLAEIAAAAPAERPRMRAHVDQELLRFVQEQILSFRVCDPGMGSGHFLVNAAHQITNFIVETLHLTPWPNETLNADPVQWRRRVVESCLYGVDINQMAVELAKLSLWLVTMTAGKPLSFLNHHLRQGNSLIGARLEDLAALSEEQKPKRRSRREEKARAAGQLSLLDQLDFKEHITVASDLMTQISARVTETLADVKAQEADYAQVRSELLPFRQLANVVIAQQFGLEISEDLAQELVKYTLKRGVIFAPAHQQLLDKAQIIRKQKLFFHWALEFPEVFFAEGSSSNSQIVKFEGFDAIIGNPPYGATLSDEELRHIVSVYTLQNYQLDTYLLFIERGLKLARQNQFLGMIIPNTWLSNLYSHQIREHIFNNVEVLTVVHYQQPVFPNVSVDTEIVIFSNRSPFSEHFIQICIIEKANCVEEYSIPQKKWQDKRGEPVNIFERPEYTAVTSKIISLPTLGELCVITQGAKPFQVGKGTPPQTRKIVNNKPYVSEIKQDKTFRPLLRGSLIERYQINWNQNYWISFGDWLAEPRYSANHDAPSKIVIRQTGDSLVAALDNEQLIVRDNLYTIVPKKQNIDLCYILALLNSSLLNWIYRKVINPEEGEAFAQVKRAHLTRLPIVNPTSLTVENDKFLTEFRSHFQISIQEDSLTLIIRFLEELQQAQQDNSLKIIQNSLAWVAQQMIALNKMSRQLVQRTDLFSIVDREINTVEFEEVFDLDRAISNIESVYHDIEGLQLNQELDGHWLLEIQVKLRNPESNWRDFQRDVEGNLIRQWLPAFRLGLDEKVGWFYHYVFANLDGFTATGNFPGGYTRTTYEKLMATKVPKHVPVDLTPLVEAEAELAETRRKIELTDKLIDQIAYKLYGLTDDEIAIVEGRV